MGVVRGDNSLYFSTAIDNSGLRKGSLDALGIIQGMSSKISSINPFAALAVGAIAAFATISTHAYQMSKNFEHAMKEVETISSETQKNFKGISQSVFELSKNTPDGPDKLAKAFYQIVSAGYDGAKGLKLLEVASKSAVAGVTDTITAADGITTVLNAFKIEAEQSERVADVMFKTVQLGKCVTGDTRVLLSDGRYVEIKNLQDGGEIVAYDGRSFIPMASEWIYQGKKPIVFLKTRLGREIKTTWNHPYLTKNGWIKVKDLNLGERIAVPTQLPFFGKKKVDKTIAEFLGLWIAEGSLRSSSPRITTAIYEYKIKDFANYFNAIYNNVEKREGRCPVYSFKGEKSGKGRNEIQNLLYSLGYDLQSKNKFIPEEVFSWNRESLAIFLRWLFNGDGWLNDKREQGRSGFSLGICFNNKKLIEDVSHLLLRFGIVGRIRKKKGVKAWMWETNRYNEIERFINFIGIDRPANSEVLNHRPEKTIKYDTSVEYDPIVEIAEVGFEDVYDLTVPNLHNFVANDIVAHNTTFSELASSMSTVAPLAAASGVSFEQVAGAVATLTKQGVPTAQAMTQIRAAIISTNEVLGDGWSETMTLQDAFQLLIDKADGSQVKLREMVGTVEAVGAVLGTTGINAKGAAEDLAAMSNAAGSSEEAFKRMASSNTNQWEILRNRIRATTKGIGDAVLEMSNGVAGGLNKLLDTNKSLVSSLIDHRKVINDLTFEYNDNNTSVERKHKILEELKKINPAIVSGLGTEKSQYVLLNNQLEAYNDLLSTRIGLEKELTNVENLKEQQDALKTSVVNLETRAKDIIKSLYNSFKNGQINSTEFGNVLNKNFKTNIEKLQELRTVINEESNKSVQLIFNTATEGYAFSAAEKDLQRYKKQLKDVSKEISQEQSKINDKIATSIEIDEDKKIQVLELLKTYKDIGKVSDQIGGKGFDVRIVNDASIQDQIKIIDKFNADIKSINTTTEEDFKKGALSKFLKSENEEIKKAAKNRVEYFKLLNDDPSDKTFENSLKTKEEQYKAYNLALENNDKEFAEKLKSQYNLKENDYVEYLRNLYKATDDHIKKTQILEALNGSKLTPNEKVSSVSEIKTQPIVFNVKLDTTSINAIEKQIQLLEEKRKAALTQTERDLLQTKIDALNNRLDVANNNVNKEDKLYADLYRNIDSYSVKELKGYIDYWNKRLITAKKGSDLYIEIESRIANATLKINERIIDQSSQLLSEASKLFREFGDNILADVIDDFNEVGKSFGNALNTLKIDSNANDLEKVTSVLGLFVTGYSKLKELTDALNKDKRLENQININQNVLEQIKIESAINKIYEDRNELIKESSILLDSLYKDDYNNAFKSSTDSLALFTKSLDALKSGALITGTGKTAGFFGIGAKDKDFNFNINDILNYILGTGGLPGNHNDVTKRDAFLGAVGSINKVLDSMGKTIDDVANFSTDEWLDFLTIVEASGKLTEETTKQLFSEAKNALEDYKNALENMRDIISDFAGSLGGDLQDALVSAFKSGEDAALSFKDSVSSVLQNLFLNELINSTFKSHFEKLQAEMESSFGLGGDQSWIDDIKRFSENISPQFQLALDAMDAFNEELISQGFTGFNGNDENEKSGLTGAIRREITEETGSELLGLFRGTYDLAKQHFEIHKKHFDASNNLVSISQEIANNTAKTVFELQNALIELKKIAENTNNIYLNDLGI